MIQTARQAQCDQDPQCRKISSSDLICWSMYSAGRSAIVDIAEPHHDQNRFESVLGVFFLLAFGLAIAVPCYLHGPIFGDEGFLASGADRVLLGELPNRDFVSLQPPFSFYAVTFVFKFLEPAPAVLRRLGLVLQEAVLLSYVFFRDAPNAPIRAMTRVSTCASPSAPSQSQDGFFAQQSDRCFFVLHALGSPAWPRRHASLSSAGWSRAVYPLCWISSSSFRSRVMRRRAQSHGLKWDTRTNGFQTPFTTYPRSPSPAL